MDYLLDTHAFIWWLQDSKQLSQKAREAIIDSNNTIYLSHATQWEISIKHSIGRLEFPMDQLASEVEENGFELLAINTQHIIQTSKLPLHHRDPFDRMLIAQAQIESLILISKDTVFPKYGIELCW